jgi:hypothetical protein
VVDLRYTGGAWLLLMLELGEEILYGLVNIVWYFTVQYSTVLYSEV